MVSLASSSLSSSPSISQTSLSPSPFSLCSISILFIRIVKEVGRRVGSMISFSRVEQFFSSRCHFPHCLFTLYVIQHDLFVKDIFDSLSSMEDIERSIRFVRSSFHFKRHVQILTLETPLLVGAIYSNPINDVSENKIAAFFISFNIESFKEQVLFPFFFSIRIFI